jgi:serine/threonine protein kinase
MEDFPEERPNMQEIHGKRVGSVDLIRKLGAGAVGQVYECQHTESGNSCVVKVLPKTLIMSHRQLNQITMEYSILSRVSHTNVVSGLNFVHGAKNLYMFMEMGGPTNLYKMMQAEGRRGLPLQMVKNFHLQIADGLAYLHSNNIAHCDLKPENVTISEDGCAKLVDFGQAVDVAEEIPVLEAPRGTMPFTPPEVMRLSPQWDPIAGDLWQVGLVFSEMLCGVDSFVRLMDWRRLNLMNLHLLPQRADEIAARFSETNKRRSLAQMSQMCATTPPSSVVEVLHDMLEVSPKRRLPATCIVSKLDAIP